MTAALQLSTQTPGTPQQALSATKDRRLSATHVFQQVALVVFAVHTLVAEDNAMDAEKAFVTLTVLSTLNKAQAFLPFSVHCLVQVRGGEGRGKGWLKGAQGAWLGPVLAEE